MWIWLLLAVLAAIGEVLTTGFFLASIAVAAVVAALVTPVAPLIVQLLLFLAVSFVGIAVLRPIAVAALGGRAPSSLAGTVQQNHLAGRRATVTRTVDVAGGQIRIGEGEFWSARAYNPDDVIVPGAVVDIQVIDGLVALVTPVTPPLLSDTDSAQSKGSYSWTP